MDRETYDKFNELCLTEQRTMAILEEFPLTRDCDRHLIFRYYNRYYDIVTLRQLAAMQVVSPETITRARRRLQSLGYFPSTKQIERLRREREKDIATFYKR